MATISEAYATAQKCFQAGDLEQAEWICGRINAVAPEYADAWYFRGVIRSALGSPDLAVDHIQRALAICPDDEEAHNNLGVILFNQGRLDEACTSIQRALKLRRDYPQAHNNLGVVLKTRGELDEAVNCFRRASQLEPDYGEAHVNLGRALLAQGKSDEATIAFRWALDIDSGDPIAEHMLAACTGENVADRASDNFIRAMFDRCANRFDERLGELGYQAPRLVANAIAVEYPGQKQSLQILDAGCGTGLCGPLVRPYAQRLVGVDLSRFMLEQARITHAYDELVEGELTAYMNGTTAAFDTVLSADTFIYFGALDKVLTAAANVLRPRGLLIFTVEVAANATGDAGFVLQSSGRYSHDQEYIERSLAQTGFILRRISPESLREERGMPVAGLVVTATASDGR